MPWLSLSSSVLLGIGASARLYRGTAYFSRPLMYFILLGDGHSKHIGRMSTHVYIPHKYDLSMTAIAWALSVSWAWWNSSPWIKFRSCYIMICGSRYIYDYHAARLHLLFRRRRARTMHRMGRANISHGINSVLLLPRHWVTTYLIITLNNVSWAIKRWKRYAQSCYRR